MSALPPIWFLDIDGVINALGFDDTAAPWEDMRSARIPSGDREYPFWYGQPVVEFVSAQVELGRDVRWATTWLDEANTQVAPRLGLPQLEVIPGKIGFSDHHYKWRAVRTAAEAGHPIIWTDDYEVDKPRREHLLALGVPVLTIKPEETVGLVQRHLDLIDAFFVEHGT
jgi:hypothetical protein